MVLQVVLNLLGFSPSGRFAKNVKGRQLLAFMGKINYYERELDLADRLLRIIESKTTSKQKPWHIESGIRAATPSQLRILSDLGIRPLWNATEEEAEEMIVDYKSFFASAHRIP